MNVVVDHNDDHDEHDDRNYYGLKSPKNNNKFQTTKIIVQQLSSYYFGSSLWKQRIFAMLSLLVVSTLLHNTLVINLYHYYYNYNPLGLHTCDCTNDKISKRLLDNACCKRSLIYVHKMGVSASKKLWWKHFPQVPRGEFANHNKNGQCHKRCHQQVTQSLDDNRDYRFIVITRNWYDALISGFLYHKSGAECWVDGEGRNWMGLFSGWLHNNKLENWEQRINGTAAVEKDGTCRQPWPPGKRRDLCQYLQEESDANGLRVYIEWSLDIYLRPLMNFSRHMKQLEGDSGEKKKTWFVCYEDMTKEYDTIHQNFTQWYTGGRPYKFPYRTVTLRQPDKIESSNKKKQQQQSTIIIQQKESAAIEEKVYVGGHSTNHDPNYRQTLYKIISQLDETLFQGEIYEGLQEFGCKGQYEELIYEPTIATR